MARESKIAARRWNWRLTAAIAVLALAGVTTAMAALKVRRFVTSDPQFELSRDRFIMRTSRKYKTQTTCYALQETSGLGHQDANTMFRAGRIERRYIFLSSVSRSRTGG